MPPTPTAPTAGPGLSAATAVVGVIGDPVSQSLSPLLHNAAFAEMGIDWVSVGFTVTPGSVAVALQGARALGIKGLSVTMPHKDAVAGLVDRRTALADRLGAVKFREHKCEATSDLSAAAQEPKRDTSSAFTERTRMLIKRGYTPKVAVELVLHETGIEHGNDPRMMEKAHADAADFLLRIRKGLL